MKKKIMILLLGAFCVSLGIVVLQSSKLIVGGIVGIGILMHYLINVPLDILIFILNIPFYFLSLMYLGKKFTLKTFVSVFVLSILSSILPNIIQITGIHPIISSIVGGGLIGIGLSLLFKINSSIGGITILAAYLKRKFNIEPKLIITLFDFIIILSSLMVFDFILIVYSLLAIATTNKVMKWSKEKRFSIFIKSKMNYLER